MKEPDIVPSKLKTNINYKVITGIILAVLVFHVYVNYVSSPEDTDVIISIFSPYLITAYPVFIPVSVI